MYAGPRQWLLARPPRTKKNPDKLTVFSAKVPVEMLEDLTLLAKKLKCSRSELIREGLEILVNTNFKVSDYRNGRMSVVTFKVKPLLLEKAKAKTGEQNQSRVVRMACILVLHKHGLTKYNKFVNGFMSNGVTTRKIRVYA